MEYVLITGAIDGLQQIASFPDIRIYGNITDLGGGKGSVNAFLPGERIEKLSNEGFEVSIVSNDAQIDPKILELANSNSSDSQVIIIVFNGEVNTLSEFGFVPKTVTGKIASGPVQIKNLKYLIKHPVIKDIEYPRKRFLSLNKSVPNIAANQVWSRSGDNFSGYTGEGVIVGIVDTGIDFTHKNFIKPDGKTRILSIWDQTLTPEGDVEKSPVAISDPVIGDADLGYGVEYDNEANGIIQATIDDGDDAPSPVRHRDKGTHGTHVAGIAAGDGSQKDGCTASTSYKYIGVAPKSDLVVVRVWATTEGDEFLPGYPPAGNQPNIIDAIMYIMNYARKKKKAVAINISLGVMTEKMDGSGKIAQAVDGMLERLKDDLIVNADTKGAAIVFSAGNSGDAKVHASFKVPARTDPHPEKTIRFSVKNFDAAEREIKIVYSKIRFLACKLTSPKGEIDFTSFTDSPKSSTTINDTGGAAKINVQLGLITVTITPSPTGYNYCSDQWKLTLKDSNPLDNGEIPVDAFFILCQPDDITHPQFIDFATSHSTLDEDGTASNAISVGAYSIQGPRADNPGLLAYFSGRGPVLDDATRLKPEIAAPGVGIFSTLSDIELIGTNCCCDSCSEFFIAYDGTSMAAPHVTGVVALMLHKNRRMNYQVIRDKIMLHNDGIPSGTIPDDLSGWGKGKLNAKKVVDEVLALSVAPVFKVVPPTAMEIQDEWSTLLEAFLRRPRGAMFSSLFHEFFQEVRLLINKNKRVATVWHRNKGPEWVRVALYAVNHPKKPLPVEIAGIHIQKSLLKMEEVFRLYGSQRLRSAIDEYEQEFALLYQGKSLMELMKMLVEPVAFKSIL